MNTGSTYELCLFLKLAYQVCNVDALRIGDF